MVETEMGYHQSNRSQYYYRCGPCNINLQHDERFSRCPKCRTPCASLSGYHADPLLTEEEAHRLLAYVEFDKRLNEETEDARQARQAEDMERQRQRAERNAMFPEVIDAGGFTDADRHLFEAIEAEFQAE